MRYYAYFTMDDFQHWLELTGTAHATLKKDPVAKLELTVKPVPVAEPVTELQAIAARVETEGLTPDLVAATVAAVEAGIEEHGLKVTDYTSGKPVDASIAPKGKRTHRIPAAA
jgi:hypothetical protein